MSINLFKPTVGNGLDRSAKQSNPEDGLPLGKGAKLPTAGAALCGRPQTQPSKRGKLKTVADPERRRWRFGITMRPVVPFVPFEGENMGSPKNAVFWGEERQRSGFGVLF